MPKRAPAGSVRICQYYGYAWVKVEDHEEFKDGWVKEHHLVWWKYRKQRVPAGYILHHKDENKLNNKVSNLELLQRGVHAKLHHQGSTRTAAQKSVQSTRAKERCTPEWRAAVSARVKLQHQKGKFGKQLRKEV